MDDAGFCFDHTFLGLPNALYSHVTPRTVAAPELLYFNDSLSASLGIGERLSDDEKAVIFSGRQMVEGGGYFSQAYAGHQFGHFTGLGDGRAVIVGEHVTHDGRRFDIQLKGSGVTPYSRRGDGLAALGPVLRECLISEAMQALGVPTTRCLAVVATGDLVEREKSLAGAVLTRVSSSHLRIGTLQYAAALPDPSVLQKLFDYTLKRHYPELIDTPCPAIAFLEAVMEKQIACVVNWMRVGFIHGVMNTDNALISGDTIDYGPCAFMDAYDPNTVFSYIDELGRYAYSNQPQMMQWNLARLAETLLPFMDSCESTAIEKATTIIHQFPALYQRDWLAMMRDKLGLFDEHDGDLALVDDLLSWMSDLGLDFTNTFRDLSQLEKPMQTVYQSDRFTAWFQRWEQRQSMSHRSAKCRAALMHRVNPLVIPRNHQVEKALDAAYRNDLAPFMALMNALKTPYLDGEDKQSFTVPPTTAERVTHTFCGT